MPSPPDPDALARVRVPGSTSNLGPGFDCMGLALAVYNEVTVAVADSPENSESVDPAHPMVEATADRFFTETGVGPFPFRWEIDGDVPISRGLGSSVTLRLGLIAGLNELVGGSLDRDQLFNICRDLEGHPDNASAGVFGGFTVTGAKGRCFQFEVGPELVCVLLIPTHEILTSEARALLPDSVPRLEAVGTLGNAAALTAAFAQRDYPRLKGCF
ncbi:MAG: homoserine kinase, partial [Verrucomicrobiota bacterium]